MDSNNVTQKSRNTLLKIIPFLLIAGLVTALIVFKAYVIIDPGHRGVVVQLGAVQPTVLSEGLHFKIPFIQEIVPIEVRVQKAQSEETTSSKDLQVVNTIIAVNYRLDPDRVNLLYQEVGLSYKEKIVDPAIGESLKAVTAQYTAEELISKRSEVSHKVKETLGEKLANYYMILDEINITEFKFSPEFNEAIEQKQIAEQQALKANLDLQRIEIEAKQKIEQARAEAEALKLQKDQITPELVELRRIEAQLEAIKKWDGKLPSVTGTGAIPFLNIDQLKE
ncbi:MAG TPA: prohibitin family protein [Peptococcaceae bacterium]|nr:prohibitin family protein [Peptococcaceae bacterium]